MTKSDSPFLQTWQRLRRHRTAMFGMGVIVVAIFVAVLAYALVPDNTPNANNQMVQIPLKNPAFSCQILNVHKNTKVARPPFWKMLLFGKPSPYKSIPIADYQLLGDSLFAKEYTDADTYQVPVYHRLHLLDVVYPLALQPNIKSTKETLTFLDIDHQKGAERRESLVQKITTQHIQTRTFWLGTDRYGRDVWSRLLIGVRISLLVGLVAVLISLTLGIVLGTLAGYFGGRTDAFISFLINTVWSIPTLLLVFAIVLALGKNIVNIFVAVGLTMWVDVARVVRGQVLLYKQKQFVEAAHSMGFRTFRILGRHLLPNILGPVLVIASANFATAILIEAGLSYLGFGIQPPTPSWGTMLNENYGYAISGKPVLALVPAFSIALLVLAFNLLGNGIRDALDAQGDH